MNSLPSPPTPHCRGFSLRTSMRSFPNMKASAVPLPIANVYPFLMISSILATFSISNTMVRVLPGQTKEILGWSWNVSTAFYPTPNRSYSTMKPPFFIFTELPPTITLSSLTFTLLLSTLALAPSVLKWCGLTILLSQTSLENHGMHTLTIFFLPLRISLKGSSLGIKTHLATSLIKRKDSLLS